jgi:hypothetical protein
MPETKKRKKLTQYECDVRDVKEFFTDLKDGADPTLPWTVWVEGCVTRLIHGTRDDRGPIRVFRPSEILEEIAKALPC